MFALERLAVGNQDQPTILFFSVGFVMLTKVQKKAMEIIQVCHAIDVHIILISSKYEYLLLLKSENFYCTKHLWNWFVFLFLTDTYTITV